MQLLRSSISLFKEGNKVTTAYSSIKEMGVWHTPGLRRPAYVISVREGSIGELTLVFKYPGEGELCRAFSARTINIPTWTRREGFPISLGGLLISMRLRH